ncbi:MAG: CDP-diacylglycerol--glycerol-3-phosphate 3-phosphatidyltransferase [Gammaproteobacteria bacterium]|jgi:CDP-diacylglycerol--glycerol-3-phosphate 3-phosphatidyltransferase
MNLNVPNMLTLLRVILIPVFAVVFFLPWEYARFAAGVIFGITAITDFLDGYLARKLNQESKLGAFLDPVADKLAVAVAMILLLQADPRVLIAAPVAIIICREITISALREWMAELGKRATVAVSAIGKIKTVAQMVAIIAMLLERKVLGLPLYEIGLVALYVAAVLTIWSMVVYLKASFAVIFAKTE